LRGSLEAVIGGRALGWAWYPAADPDRRVALTVHVDGRPAAAGVAMLFSADLHRRGIGDGGHAFAIELPEDVRDGRRHRVAVSAPDGRTLAVGHRFHGTSPPADPWFGTTFLPSVGPPRRRASTAAMQGRVEAVVDGRVAGWAFDPAHPDRRVPLKVSVDGEPVGDTVADLPRPSLAADGIGDGRHAFLLRLPERLADSDQHRLAVHTRGGHPLAASEGFSARAEAPPWAGTTFSYGGDGAVGPAPSRTQSVADEPGTDTRARDLVLRPASAMHFPRVAEAPSPAIPAAAETIVLAGEVAVARRPPALLRFQTGVRERRIERLTADHDGGRYTAQPMTVTRLPGGIVDTRSFVLCPTEAEFLTNSVRVFDSMSFYGYEVGGDGSLRRSIKRLGVRPERVVPIGAQTHPNYMHWLLECLARVAAFTPVDDGECLFLAPRLTHWQRDSLALAGVPAERILEVRPHGLVRFAEVLAVSRGVSDVQSFIPAAIARLAALAPATGERRRLYCSRQTANARRIANHDQVEDVLRRHGFDTVLPEELSVAEQVRCFAGAEAVIGIHGAGMGNVVFSPPGTTVVELAPEGHPGWRVFWNLAAVRDHRYAAIVCRHADGQDAIPASNRDVVVDAVDLDRSLTQLLA
jgi:hypothetical protein